MRPFGKSRRRLEDNIKVVLKEGGCEVVNWIQLAKDVIQSEMLSTLY